LILGVLSVNIFLERGDSMTDIGINIAKRRTELGLTQEELAKRMGYKSKTSINKIEKGINDIPQTKIVKFAEVLRTTPAYLMGWEKTEKKNNAIVDIVARMRTDEDFLSLVESLNELEAEKIIAFKQLISTLLK
jgi:transcriptional regulator with XRE-family HTH domain